MTVKLSYRDLCTIKKAISVYRMYLYEDYDKEEDFTLKDRIYKDIDNTNRIMMKILKAEV